MNDPAGGDRAHSGHDFVLAPAVPRAARADPVLSANGVPADGRRAWFDPEQTAAALAWPTLIEALRSAFSTAHAAPPRTHHDIAVLGRPVATLLVMPAWIEGNVIGVKVATVFPGNAADNRNAVNATYVMMSATTGEPLCLIDADTLTNRRTAAASALASSFLSRSDSRTLLIVGTGRMAPALAHAHAAVRRLDRVMIWGRSGDKATTVARALAPELDAEVRAVGDLAEAVAGADIVSCATLSTEPIVRGAWLRPGCHLDLVGAFRATMRETDAAAVARAAVYVDTREGARHEAGDLIQAAAEGAFALDLVRGDLADLCSGRARGRAAESEITLFKSVGASIEDLAAARLVHAYHRPSGTRR